MSKEQIKIEDLFAPLPELIEKYAKIIYKNETGKTLKEEEHPPEEYYTKSKEYLITFFQSELKRIYYTVKPLIGYEEPIEYIKRQEIKKKIPSTVEEYLMKKFGYTKEQIEKGNLVCPKCKKELFGKVAEGYWMCKACGYSISLPKLYEGREPTV